MRKWYREVYLKSEHWLALRSEALQHHGRKCSMCSASKRLDVHHLRYKGIFDVEVADLQILCRACHKKEHLRQKRPPQTKPTSFMGALWKAYSTTRTMPKEQGYIIFWFIIYQYKRTLDLPPEEESLAQELLGHMFEWHWE